MSLPSLVAANRLAFLAREAERTRTLPGDMAELGVWKGGSARTLVDAAPDKKLHLFDTFTGLPEPSEHDPHLTASMFNDASEEAVRDALQGFNVEFYVGEFPGTLTPQLEDTEFCLVHLDADLYEPTKAALEFFWPRLMPGGAVVLDDYNHPRCTGVNKAVDEFFRQEGVQFVSLGKDGQAGTRVVKRCSDESDE